MINFSQWQALVDRVKALEARLDALTNTDPLPYYKPGLKDSDDAEAQRQRKDPQTARRHR